MMKQIKSPVVAAGAAGLLSLFALRGDSARQKEFSHPIKSSLTPMGLREREQLRDIADLVEGIFGDRTSIERRLSANYTALSEKERRFVDAEPRLNLAARRGLWGCILAPQKLSQIVSDVDSMYLLFNSNTVPSVTRADLIAYAILSAEQSQDGSLLRPFATQFIPEVTDQRLGALLDAAKTKGMLHVDSTVSVILLKYGIPGSNNPVEECVSVIRNSNLPKCVRMRGLYSAFSYPEGQQPILVACRGIIETEASDAELRNVAQYLFNYHADNRVEAEMLNMLWKSDYASSEKAMALRALNAIDSKQALVGMDIAKALDSVTSNDTRDSICHLALKRGSAGQVAQVIQWLVTEKDEGLGRLSEMLAEKGIYFELSDDLLIRNSYDPSAWRSQELIDALVKLSEKKGRERQGMGFLCVALVLDNWGRDLQSIAATDTNNTKRIQIRSRLIESFPKTFVPADVEFITAALGWVEGDAERSKLTAFLKEYPFCPCAPWVRKQLYPPKDPEGEKPGDAIDWDAEEKQSILQSSFTTAVNEDEPFEKRFEALALIKYKLRDSAGDVKALYTCSSQIEQLALSPVPGFRRQILKFAFQANLSKESKIALGFEALGEAREIVSRDPNKAKEAAEFLTLAFAYNPLAVCELFATKEIDREAAFRRLLGSDEGAKSLGLDLKRYVMSTPVETMDCSEKAKGYVANLKKAYALGIRTPLRFSTDTLKLLIKDYEIDLTQNRKRVLFLAAVGDHNGVFSALEGQMKKFHDQGDQVVYRDYYLDTEFEQVTKKLSDEGEGYIDVISFCQHADPSSGSAGVEYDSKPSQDEQNIDYHDIPKLEGHFRFLKKGAIGFVNGCASAGATEGGVKNLAQTYFELASPLKSLFAPETPIGLIGGGFDFDQGKNLTKVVYKSPTVEFTRVVK